MTTTDTTAILTLAIEDNLGYSAEQVAGSNQSMTLYELLALVEGAIERYGEDALVVTDNGQQYGARFGVLDIYRDTMVPAGMSEEDEDY